VPAATSSAEARGLSVAVRPGCALARSPTAPGLVTPAADAVIHAQREKPRAQRRETCNPHAHTAASFRQGSARSLDCDAAEGLLDRRAYLRRGQATRDEQAAHRPILLR
jgi:hypothetical protein